MGMIKKKIGCCLLTRIYMYITCLFTFLCSRELNAITIPPKTLSQPPYQVLDRYFCTSSVNLLSLKSTICKNILGGDKQTITDISALHENFKQASMFHHCKKLTDLDDYTSSKSVQNVTKWCHISNELLVTVETKENRKIVLSLIRGTDNLKSNSKNNFHLFHKHMEMDQNTFKTLNGTNATVPTTSNTTTLTPAPKTKGPDTSIIIIVVVVVVVILVILTAVICWFRRRNNMSNVTSRIFGKSNNGFQVNDENNYDNNGIVNNHFEPTTFILENDKVRSIKNDSQQYIDIEINKKPIMPPKSKTQNNGTYSELDLGKCTQNSVNSPVKPNNDFYMDDESDYDNINGTNNSHFVPTPFVLEKTKVSLTKSNSQQNNGANKTPMMPPTPNIRPKVIERNDDNTTAQEGNYMHVKNSERNLEEVKQSSFDNSVKPSDDFYMDDESDYDNINGTNNTHFVPTPFVLEKTKVSLTKSNSQQNNGANKTPMMPPTPNIRPKVIEKDDYNTTGQEGMYVKNSELKQNSFDSPLKPNNDFHINEEGDYDNVNKTNNMQFVPTPFTQQRSKDGSIKTNNGTNKIPIMPPTPNIRPKVGAMNAKKTGVCNERNENLKDKQIFANEGMYSELNLVAQQKDDVYEGLNVQSVVDTNAKNNTRDDHYETMTNNKIGSVNNDDNTTDLEGNYMYMGNNNEGVSGSNCDSSIYEVGYVIPKTTESESEGYYVPMTENNIITSNCDDENIYSNGVTSNFNDDNIYSNNMTSNCDDKNIYSNGMTSNCDDDNIYSNEVTSNHPSYLDENIYDDTISPDDIYSNTYEPSKGIDKSINNAAGSNDDYYVVPAINESIQPFTHVDKSSGVQSSSCLSEYDHGYMVSPITERKTFAE